MLYKSMLKSKLAEKADVSDRTFSRWLRQHRAQLQQMGVAPNARLLPPHAVKYICEEYGIILDENKLR